MYLLRVILKSKHNNLTKQTKMKKVIAIFAIATTLVACGGNASTEATATDSTAVDSTVVAVDSAAVVADTTAVAPAEVK
jgi:ABC-type glycerol-3-phosphate transport system substrate-binding protein